MGWFEDIQTNIVIETGEGSKFSPQWLNAGMQKEFNTKEFNFPNTDGTLVIRRRPKSKTYSLELYFQGDDHLDQSRLFDTAADDPRPWKITHPFYNSLTVQPSSITFDNSVYNITKITCTVRETITAEGVKVSVNPVDKVSELSEETLEVVAEEFETVPIEAGDVTEMSDSADLTFERYNKTENSQSLRNQYNKARSAISGAIAKPITAMREAQRLLNFPVAFEKSTAARFETLKAEFDNLILTIESGAGLSYFQRKYFENQSNAVITGMCGTVVTDPDYQTRKEVFKQSEELEEVYDLYVVALNSIQGENGYFPSRESLFILEGLVNFTINNLNEIALDTQQERSVFLESNSDVISLAHRFYGSENKEANIERIKSANNIGINRILEIPKGTEIFYYV